MIKRLDIVRITTTKNVNWVSGPSGRPAEPKGEWSVTGANGNLLLLSKDQTIIQIPYGDVVLVAKYDIKRVIENVKRVKTKADIQRGVSDEQKGQGPEEAVEI